MTTVTSVRPRLLYLEDDPVIAEMTCEVLAEAYEVEHVADGTAGRRRALDGRFDVMLIDRRLPSVDGAEIIAAVRTARITTPILVLTFAATFRPGCSRLPRALADIPATLRSSITTYSKVAARCLVSACCAVARWRA